MWCSLGHGRKFSKDGPSACRINGHINHMKLVMFLLNVKKETKAIVLMYFLHEVLFKKIKIALCIAFSWIVKKKLKNAFRIAILRPATGNRLVFFFGLIMIQVDFRKENLLAASIYCLTLVLLRGGCTNPPNGFRPGAQNRTAKG